MTFRPNNDILFQEVKVFIEGVQVPFTNVQVNSGVGTLPSAVVTIPPFPGLMEICRYYTPKVHVFYVDPFKDAPDNECVLFMGHAVNIQYNRSRQSGVAMITFNCNHKNALMQDILIDFNNPMENTNLRSGVRIDNAVSMNAMSSTQAIQSALRGICNPEGKLAFDDANAEAIKKGYEEKDSEGKSKSTELGDPGVLSNYWINHASRFRGFPGVLMNLWNQYKRNSIVSPADFECVLAYTNVVEIGIKYFNRLAGHPIIEDAMDKGKQTPCGTKTKGEAASDPINVPPSLRLFVQSAVQADISLQVIQQGLNFSGELADLISLFANILDRIEYEMLTLNSPAETRLNFDEEWDPETNSEAVETIVKPQIPFYYSPSCNVYYPNMYHSLNIMQDENNIPTRITIAAKVTPIDGSPAHKNYRAPASVREAIAKSYRGNLVEFIKEKESKSSTPPTEDELIKLYTDANLLKTTDGLVGRTRMGTYEWGRGIRHKKSDVPYWLSIYMSKVNQDKEDKQESKAGISDEDRESLETLKAAWNYRHGDHKKHLNPYDEGSSVAPHERLLFAAADYKYTMEIASARMGQLDGIFNPYIIPGYPMEILDSSSTNPCFHATCMSVTHNISSAAISTYVSFAAAMTYSELANYHMMYVHPWLQTHLKITTEDPDNETEPPGQDTTDPNFTGIDPVVEPQSTKKYISTIINNPAAKEIADEFYDKLLRVKAVAPNDVYDFNKGTIRPVQTVHKIVGYGHPLYKENVKKRELNPIMTAEGSLLLVSRPIETRALVEARFRYKFIDMAGTNYNPTILKYSDSEKALDQLLEPGQSPFLDYTEIIKY